MLRRAAGPDPGPGRQRRPPGPAARGVRAKIGVVRQAAGDRFTNLEINAFGTFIITGKRRAGPKT
jgi:hypothetical protein